MNIHDRMESIADLHAAGALAAEERAEADRHAAGCSACATILRDARVFATWISGAIAPDAPPADLEDRLIARFRATGPVKKRRFPMLSRALKTVGGLAAVVAFIFAGAAFTEGAPGPMLWNAPTAEHDFYLQDGREGKLGWGFADNKTRGLSRKLEGGVGNPQTGATFTLDDAKGDSAPKKDELAKNRQRLAESDALGVGGGGGGEGRFGGRFGGRENLVARGGGTAELAAAAPSLLPTIQDNRKIIRNADVRVEVDSYDDAAKKLADLVAAEKGMIAGANTQRLANGKMSAVITIRIPPERFEPFLAALAGLGTVRSQNIRSQDVTKQYVDLEARLKSKETLAERLRKILAEAKGNVKELMEVEVQLGGTQEAIEQIKGEIKYYDNQVGLSTIALTLTEKDLGQPFEYVQTLQAAIGLTVRDVDGTYSRAQKEVTDAGGQVVDSKMARQSDGTSTGTIRGRVDADKFPALREALKKLGHVTNDTVNQQKTARGGTEGTPKPEAPLRKEQAVVDVTVSSPPIFVTRKAQITVEHSDVDGAYQSARQAVEAAGGKIVDGALQGGKDHMSAMLKAQVDADKFTGLVAQLKKGDKVKGDTINQYLPAATGDGAPPLLRERAEIDLVLESPPKLIGEDQGLVRTIRDTVAGSWKGVLWSIEKLFVGISLAGPWIVLGIAAWIVYRRVRRKKAAQPAP